MCPAYGLRTLHSSVLLRSRGCAVVAGRALALLVHKLLHATHASAAQWRAATLAAKPCRARPRPYGPHVATLHSTCQGPYDGHELRSPCKHGCPVAAHFAALGESLGCSGRAQLLLLRALQCSIPCAPVPPYGTDHDHRLGRPLRRRSTPLGLHFTLPALRRRPCGLWLIHSGSPGRGAPLGTAAPGHLYGQAGAAHACCACL